MGPPVRRLRGSCAHLATEAPDEYRCFVVDWLPTDETYVTGFAVEPGDTGVVHPLRAVRSPTAPVGPSR